MSKNEEEASKEEEKEEKTSLPPVSEGSAGPPISAGGSKTAATTSTKRRVSRRGLFIGAGVGVLAAGLEYVSLRGTFDHRRWPGDDPLGAPGSAERYAASLRQVEGGASGIVHVSHSTHLLALGGMRLLTDPWFYDPAFGALSHDAAPAVLPSGVGKLDAILVTHDHADHADLRAMDEMDKSAVVIVATNDLAAKVRARGFSDVSVLAPWEERKLGSDVIVTAVPAIHDIYEVGYVVRTLAKPKGGETVEKSGFDKSVYFAGDTRLHPDLPAIKERFAPTMAILPVDGTRLSGGALHVMTPEDAVTAARTLGAKLVMPSHADAYFSDPLAKYVLASTVPRARSRFAELIAKDLPSIACKVPAPGELIVI